MPRIDSAQRARILEAAVPVFAGEGLEGAAIRTVAHAAGVNSALLYYYFENKHTLFVEAVRHVIRGLVDHLAARLKVFKNGRQRLEFLVGGILDFYEAHPAGMKLMALALVRHSDLVAQGLESVIRDRVLVPIDVLQEGIQRGELRPVHPLQAWWSILGMCLFTLEMREVARHVDPSILPLPVPDPVVTREEMINFACHGLLGEKTRKGKRS
jgi:TetR/AcrR family transcriptional regulator